jgi:hypothetical protein
VTAFKRPPAEKKPLSPEPRWSIYTIGERYKHSYFLMICVSI